jgi:LuxR family maltose regulon positive regulatory protein
MRLDPPLNVARLRGRGQMTELRQDDLRFTPEEVTRFLNEAMGLQLTANQLPPWPRAPKAGSLDCRT